jgi:hypothetical protein
MNDFFPTEDYKIPSTSNYMKFLEGENAFRVLSSAVVGYEYFNNESKPIRSKTPFDETPEDIKKDSRINHFWAFAVWNYEDKRSGEIPKSTTSSLPEQEADWIPSIQSRLILNLHLTKQ